MSKRRLLWALVGLWALICFAFFFWLAGGVHWLDKDVPPRRPSFMPANSVWIDAPSLPLSWHHGWSFGCGVSSSGTTNHCRLVLAGGTTVYEDDYLSCRTRAPVSENALKLIPPPHGSFNMWLFGEGSDGVAGFTQDSDILLPVGVIAKCDRVTARWTKRP